MNKFYVYCYVDSTKERTKYLGYDIPGLPFYIGKGCGERLNRHIVDAKSEFCKKLPKHYKILKMLREENEPLVIILKDNLSEKEAFDLEKLLILTIGRKDLKKGPLLNCTNGGEGESQIPWNKGKEGYHIPGHSEKFIGNKNPFYGRHHSQETKKHISEANKGKSFRKGSHHSEESKLKMSQSKKGMYLGEKNPMYGKKVENFMTDDAISEMNRKRSENFKGDKNPSKRKDVQKKISDAKSKTWKITSPEGDTIIYKGNLRKFCEEHNLVVQLLRAVAQGKRENYKNWKCEYVLDDDVYTLLLLSEE